MFLRCCVQERPGQEETEWARWSGCLLVRRQDRSQGQNFFLALVCPAPVSPGDAQGLNRRDLTCSVQSDPQGTLILEGGTRTGQGFRCHAESFGRDPWKRSITKRRCCQHQVSSQLAWHPPASSSSSHLSISTASARGPAPLRFLPSPRVSQSKKPRGRAHKTFTALNKTVPQAGVFKVSSGT